MNLKRVNTAYGYGVTANECIIVFTDNHYVVLYKGTAYKIYRRDLTNLEIGFIDDGNILQHQSVRELFIVNLLADKGIAEYKLTGDTVASLSYPNGINTTVVSVDVQDGVMSLVLNVSFLLLPLNLITFDNISDDRSKFKSLFPVCGFLLPEDSKLLVVDRDDNALFMRPQVLHTESVLGYVIDSNTKYNVFTIEARYEDVINITNGNKSYRIPKEWIERK